MSVGKAGVLGVQTPPEIVRIVIDSFNFLCQNAEEKFNLIFITASKTLTDVDGTMSVPRFLKKKKKQINRDNY
jgi:hypothetical protein